MSRRKGQNPKLRIGTRNDGTQYFYFQYWLDVPGVEDRKRRREILGPVKTAKVTGLTKTEAEAKKMQFLAHLVKCSFKSGPDQLLLFLGEITCKGRDAVTFQPNASSSSCKPSPEAECISCRLRRSSG